jgi:hypothetical protein
MNSLACSYYIKGFLCFQVLLQKKRADRNLPSYNVQLFTEVSLKKTCESLAVAGFVAVAFVDINCISYFVSNQSGESGFARSLLPCCFEMQKARGFSLFCGNL